MANNRNDNGMSREEAGQKGGETTSKTHDKEFYQDIGQKGGEATADSMAKSFTKILARKAVKTAEATLPMIPSALQKPVRKAVRIATVVVVTTAN